MAPRSPTYELSSGALEYHPQNYSPFNHLYKDDTQPRTVHFSEPPIMPTQARHSIATSHVPLLPSVPSASQIPKHVIRPNPPPAKIDLNAAIEYHKSTAEHLRKIHDNDRKAWDIEKSALLARIADLEFKLNKARDPHRRSSNESSLASAHALRSDVISRPPFTNGIHKAPSEPILPGAPPIWHGPENTPPVTRVFSHDDDVSHLPSISEDAPMQSLSKQVSPTTKEDAQSIPIEHIDKELDGINVRSTGPAVTSSFVKINSPTVVSPERAPSPGPAEVTNGTLKVDMNRLLSPLDEKLKRHAGHTPMAFDGAISTENTTDGLPTPQAEQPPEPAPTTRPPIRPKENSDSYFSFSGENPAKPSATVDTIPEEAIVDETPQLENDEDPALKGPLMLDPSARSQAANVFLEQVDAKLKEAATHKRADSVLSDDGQDSATNGEKKKEEDNFPQLRIKKSTNFGSAWGGDMPGRI